MFRRRRRRFLKDAVDAGERDDARARVVSRVIVYGGV
jgi:hypothetical protein